MSKLDDPLDASFEEYSREDEISGAELARKLAGDLFWPVALVNTAFDHFRTPSRRGRLLELLEALITRVKRLEAKRPNNDEESAKLESNLGSEVFLEAWTQAAEEAVRTSDRKKIQRFAAVLAGTVDPANSSPQMEDLPALIRDVAQLGELDLEVLKILEAVYSDAIVTNPNMHDPNVFNDQINTLLKKVGESGMHREFFYSHCARLSGFELAIEVPRNPSRVAPGDYCFRPTRRGMDLLALLRGH